MFKEDSWVNRGKPELAVNATIIDKDWKQTCKVGFLPRRVLATPYAGHLIGRSAVITCIVHPGICDEEAWNYKEVMRGIAIFDLCETDARIFEIFTWNLHYYLIRQF